MLNGIKSEDIVSDSAANNILSIYRRHAEAFASQRSRALFEKSWLDKFITVIKAIEDFWLTIVKLPRME